MGRLIPAGSGIPRYRNFEAVVNDENEVTKSVTLNF
jgi:hypothetical protein